VVAKAVLHDRAEQVSGSFFDNVPPGADAYLLKTVIHDWQESQAIQILSNVRRVMPRGGRLVLVESVIPDSPEFMPAKWGDLHMLALCGGRERSAAEFGELLGRSGFELLEIIPTRTMYSILISQPH
jgi:ubiquinone/menaquinone biosynthesis C-methylase UbiE